MDVCEDVEWQPHGKTGGEAASDGPASASGTPSRELVAIRAPEAGAIWVTFGMHDVTARVGDRRELRREFWRTLAQTTTTTRPQVGLELRSDELARLLATYGPKLQHEAWFDGLRRMALEQQPATTVLLAMDKSLHATRLADMAGLSVVRPPTNDCRAIVPYASGTPHPVLRLTWRGAGDDQAAMAPGASSQLPAPTRPVKRRERDDDDLDGLAAEFVSHLSVSFPGKRRRVMRREKRGRDGN